MIREILNEMYKMQRQSDAWGQLEEYQQRAHNFCNRNKIYLGSNVWVALLLYAERTEEERTLSNK